MVRFDRVATRLSLALSIGLVTMFSHAMFSQAIFAQEVRARNFVRGNANADASVDLSDVVFSLEYLYLGGPTPSCLDAADTNDDGALDVADPVLSLFQQFHGAEVPGPRPDCGEDPTEDNLTCLAFAPCPLDCFDQRDLEILVAQNFETEDCLLAPALTEDLGLAIAVVCPPGLRTCPNGRDGCPFKFTKIDPFLLVDDREVSIDIEVVMASMPIRITPIFGGASNCDYRVVIQGTGVVPFQARDNGNGTLTVTSIGKPVINPDDVTLEFIAIEDPGLCSLVPDLADGLKGEIIGQFAPSLDLSLEPIRAALIGEDICATP